MRYPIGLSVAFLFSSAALALGSAEARRVQGKSPVVTEALVIGKWKTPKDDLEIQFTEKKTFSFVKGSMPITGSWRLDKGDVVVTPELFQGKPVAEVKKKLLAHPDKLGPGIKNFAEELDKPNIFAVKVGKVGVSMTTDSTRDKSPAIVVLYKMK